MKYYIGIDGGGTKTRFLCVNECNEQVNDISLPTCHVLQTSFDESVSILRNGLNQILEQVPKDSKVYICAGLAGYGNNESLRNRIEEIAASAFLEIPYLLVNDARIALAGALNNEDGILVIAGTGSIALAKSKDKITRSGGWGYMLGDEGSAYWIAKELLSEFTRQCDGRSMQTEVVEALKTYCELNNEYDIINYISDKLNNDRAQIARLARVVFDLAKKGDQAAIRIFDDAGYEIARLMNALAKELNTIYHASYAGGVFNSGEMIINPIKAHLQKNVILQKPYHEPVYGAVLLARENFD